MSHTNKPLSQVSNDRYSRLPSPGSDRDRDLLEESTHDVPNETASLMSEQSTQDQHHSASSSHANENPSQPLTGRYSWITLSGSHDDTLDEFADHGADIPRESTSPISRHSSRGLYNHEPSLCPATRPNIAGAYNGLINTDLVDSEYTPAQASNDRHSLDRASAERIPGDRHLLDGAKVLPPTDWLPYTLRHFYLTSLAAVSLSLSAILAVLCWFSIQNQGLAKDDGSIGMFFGWRYTPTIIAVFFTQAVVAMAEDVKSTEAFARMSCSEPAKAEYTILLIPKVWWKSVSQDWSRKQSSGRKGWVLPCSSLVVGISLLVVSTFSSSVFVAKDVIPWEPVQLRKYTTGQNATAGTGSLELKPRRSTYSHTISGFLLNATTSTWLTDSSIVMPFVPVAGNQDHESLPNGMWEAETRVFRMESSCVPMVMTEKTLLDVSYVYTETPITYCENDTCVVTTQGFKLRSDDDCEIQIQSPIATWSGAVAMIIPPLLYDTLQDYGGAMWTNMSSSYISWQDLVDEYGEIPPLRSSEKWALEQWTRTFIYSFSDQCIGRDLLLISPPWRSMPMPSNENSTAWQSEYWANYTARAEVCTPAYYEAKMPVTVAVSGGGQFVSYDLLEFERLRQPISKAIVNPDQLNKLTFQGDWKDYVPGSTGSIDGVSMDGFNGLSMLLAQYFSQNLTNMLQNESLGYQTSRLRTRFARELLLSSIIDSDTPSLETIPGKLQQVERRVLVVREVCIMLSVLFLLLACYFTAMLWGATTNRRPLSLKTDPGTATGTTSLLGSASSITLASQASQKADRSSLLDTLGNRIFALRAGCLVEREREQSMVTSSGIGSAKPTKSGSWSLTSIESRKGQKYDWRPSMLQKRWLTTLLIVLVIVATSLLVLRKLAIEQNLYRTAFVYQVDLGIFNANFSPHSVIATLIAVGIGLCWSGIDKPMRTLQPYLSMSRKSVPVSRGAGLSYQSSYLVWAAVKAASRRHWILCLVAIGMTLSQVLTISMAAVFERKAVFHTQDTEPGAADPIAIYVPLQLREQPFQWGSSISTGRSCFKGINMSEYECSDPPAVLTPVNFDDHMLQTTKSVWLYSALDEITLKTPQLPWTRNEWIFTPINLDGLPNDTVHQKTGLEGKSHKATDKFMSPANVSFVTTVLRSRLECTPIDVPASGWLDRAADVWPERTNATLDGYVLPTVLFRNESYRTPVFTAPRRLACCSNGTGSDRQSVVAYWTSNSSMVEERPAKPVDQHAPKDLLVRGPWYQNFTIKWIIGPSASTVISGANFSTNASTIPYGVQGYQYSNEKNEELLYFTEIPKISIMNCVPVIENTTASVTVARESQQILNYEILEDPEPAPGAWDYAWDVIYPDPMVDTVDGNISYGHFFMTQMLTAPHIANPLSTKSWIVYNGSLEDRENERFNIRDTDQGLNVDFMSYANWHLANKDSEALLNTTTLLHHSEKTLQTFFKHFAVSGTVSINGLNGPEKTVYEDNSFAAFSGDTTNGTLSTRIEILAMNEVATWLSLGILFILIIILSVLIVSLQVVYPSSCMQRHVECLADVLVMVAGSDELKRLVHEQGVEGLEKCDVETRLGWFRDKRGVVRWGIEVVDGDVEWLEGPESSAEIEDVQDDNSIDETRDRAP